MLAPRPRNIDAVDVTDGGSLLMSAPHRKKKVSWRLQARLGQDTMTKKKGGNRSYRENACAVLALGQPPNKYVININDFHCAAGHFHEVQLPKTAKQQGIVLEGELLKGRVCSMAKGLRKSIEQSTRTRADKKLGRILVDWRRPKVVESLERGRCTLLVRDAFSRRT